MRAVVAAEINPNEPLAALSVTDMPEPAARQEWASIRTQAVTVNHHDLWSLQGVGLQASRLPMILGTDVCGVVETALDGRPDLPVGSEVVAYTVVGLNGQPGDASVGTEQGVASGERRSILSEYYAGTMAEYTSVPVANLFAKPQHLTAAQAAALGTSWLTAYSMLFTAAGVKPGDSVLIQGAGGGVSTAAVQMAHAAGLEVFVCSRSEAKRSRVVQLGADWAGEPGERLPHKVDAVLDSVGSTTWAHSVRSVRPGGTIAVCGATTGDMPGAELTRIFFQDLRVQGVTMGSRADFARMLRFVEHQRLVPVIAQTWTVNQARQAFVAVMEGTQFGKAAIAF
ncbi:quinone oxidoreductase [Bifidobacterium dolichotidis]|uniref:Quinone oxidoreductase n=1 Tax=Bifidobacterium dolichotidis TaxID=2306976 RepID=A0A430FPR7_9BIFI|nr:zinc-binding dehydrogenase [Bifidobacterium dolichotidis]RSX54821.1 quinone oxidoreductase [Bifidobacterium dolichotidis]